MFNIIYRNMWHANQLTGFYMRATMALDRLSKIYLGIASFLSVVLALLFNGFMKDEKRLIYNSCNT